MYASLRLDYRTRRDLDDRLDRLATEDRRREQILAQKGKRHPLPLSARNAS
ncbi:MAG: hypothetical protein ACREQ5_18425 [Candidatus Dormibacteria bacterium]